MRIISIEFASKEGKPHPSFFGQVVVDVAADPVAKSANASGHHCDPVSFREYRRQWREHPVERRDTAEEGVSEEETTDISVDVSLPVTWTEDGESGSAM